MLAILISVDAEAEKPDPGGEPCKAWHYYSYFTRRLLLKESPLAESYHTGIPLDRH